MAHAAKALVTDLLQAADITVNGSRPWDIQVHDERVYRRILGGGSLGVGESYMDGWWSCDALDDFFTRVFQAELERDLQPLRAVIAGAVAWVVNQQRRSRAFVIGQKHYDLGNDLYTAMLDRRLTYTCGYWDGGAQTLDEAQEAKLDLVCRKIGLERGMRVLDIGCGWGSFATFAAQRYGAEVVGVTVSKEQIELGKQRCAGLPVALRLQDYREVTGRFNRVVSLGMFEHVGAKNYRNFFQVVHHCLAPDGLALLHTIGGNHSVHSTDPWIARYIFPNSMLPSVTQIAKASERLFVMEDWHNFGANYDTTLMAWWHNFSTNWPILHASGRYDDRFYRMWQFYLLACAGSFRARKNQLWQIVLSPHGVPGGYRSLR